MKTRILSLMLVLAMVLALLPTAALAAGAYNVWVNGVQVTDSNKSNVLGGGTVSYDPATKTLTLNGATITETYFESAIRSETDLTVNVKGNNSIALAGETGAMGLDVRGSLLLTGTGNLTIQNEGTDQYAILSQSTVTVDMSGKLTINAGYDGIAAPAGVELCGNGDVKITAIMNCLSVNSGSVTISGGKVDLSSPFRCIFCNGYTFLTGSGDVTLSGGRGIGGNGGGVVISGSGNVTITTESTAISVERDVVISGSGDVMITAGGPAADSSTMGKALNLFRGNSLVISGTGSVDIYGCNCALYTWESGSKALLNGSANPVSFRAGIGGKVWDEMNRQEDDLVVAGTNLSKYNVTGSLTSESLVYTLKEPVMPFVDVKEGDFFYDPVLWAVKNNITNGVDATHFGPGNDCLRAQVVTFLWRAAGQPEPKTTNNPFVDVKSSDFYYKPVLWAVENKITSGMDATHFGPMEKCNRAQVVTFLYRAAGSPSVSGSNPFVDVPKGSFYEAPVLWAVSKGITNGMDATHFGPTTICNRAQIVTFLYRAYK